MSDEDKPKSKKLKREEEDDDDDEEEEENSDGPAVEKNEKGEAFFKISAKRRVTISKFKGTTMIDIREFYGEDDDLKPGKKGISLPVNQYHVLRDLIVGGKLDQVIESLEKERK